MNKDRSEKLGRKYQKVTITPRVNYARGKNFQQRYAFHYSRDSGRNISITTLLKRLLSFAICIVASHLLKYIFCYLKRCIFQWQLTVVLPLLYSTLFSFTTSSIFLKYYIQNTNKLPISVFTMEQLHHDKVAYTHAEIYFSTYT